MSAVRRTAFGQILGHPTRPNIRYFNAPDDGGGAGGDTGDTSGSDEMGDDGDGLGDKGKQALDRMKRERNDARQEAAAFKALGLTVEQIKALQTAPQKPIDVPDAEAIQKAAENELTTRLEATARRTAVREQARALGFHDVKDALAEIDTDALSKVTVTDDEADAAAIAALVKAVADKKPYLVKTTDASAQDAGIGGVGGGAKPEPRTPTQRMANAYASSSRSN